MEIKELTELIVALQSLADAIKYDSEDGKLTILEILGNYPELMTVIAEAGDYEAILQEIGDLDEEEVLSIAMNSITFIYTIIAIVQNLK